MTEELHQPREMAVRDDEVYVFPASFAQERMWHQERLTPGLPLFNLPLAFHLEGELDTVALRAAAEDLLQRHEVLRTTFAAATDVTEAGPEETAGADVVQLVHVGNRLDWEDEDLSTLPEGQRRAAAERRLEDEAIRPLDLSRGPLFRLLLLRLAPQQHALLLLLHHIVADGWSLGVICRELEEGYRARRAGSVSNLPELPIQYGDFAYWQRTGLDGGPRVEPGGNLEGDLEYWRHRLGDDPPPLELPFDRRPQSHGFGGADLSVDLPKTLMDGVAILARRAGTTPFMVLLAVFQLLLGRLADRSDVVVGTPVAGRETKDVEGLVGLFVNLLVLRTDLKGDPTFLGLLERVHRVAAEAHAHGRVPFDQVVRELRPSRRAGRHPLFQAALGLQDAQRMRTLQLPGLTVRPQRLPRGVAQYDLYLSLGLEHEALGEALSFLEYSTDRFDRTTAERIAALYRTLLKEVVADPTRPLSRLPLITPEEERQVLAWNPSPTPYPRQATLMELFAERVAAAPEAVALVDVDGTCLTYAALARRAHRLAYRLRQLDVGPETPVAVALERSAQLVVALLGVLEAGGFYVPLDPEYPPPRLAAMLADSGAAVLLTQEAVRGSLLEPQGEDPRPRTVSLDGESEQIDRLPVTPLPRARIAGDQLAYVIYTSGSTGRPKGVAVPHRGVMRLVRGTNYVRLGPEDRVAQASNASFDAATFEIWGALLAGARLVILPPSVILAPENLELALIREGVTALFLTTALFNQVVEQAPQTFATVEHLLFGGESVDPERVRRLLAESPPDRLLHVYGPTESTTFTTWYEVRDVPELAPTVPIGHPVAQTTVHVADRHLRPVPPAVSGELLIGGDGLARGYWRQPATTAERFVPDPFAREPGSRLYRSGDRVRRRMEGPLEFLGRFDGQVKLRGFRIELGEVEAALHSHRDIAQAVAVVREDAPRKRRLVAYVVLREDSAPDMSEVRQHLRQRLPGFMIPAALVALERLPLTPNGKLDRRALPEVENTRRDVEAEYSAPRNAPESCLVELWEEVLGVEGIGIGDNFFELGGDSILSLRLASRGRQEGLEVAAQDIFEHQTIRALAAHLRSASPPLSAVGQDPQAVGAVPLTPIQHWFFELAPERPQHFNQSLLLTLRRRLDPQCLDRIAHELLTHHGALRLRFHHEDSGWRQEYADAETAQVVESLDLADLPVSERSAVRTAEVARLQGSLDLSRGPLIRLGFFEEGSDAPQQLLWVVHHLAVDAVSWGILIEDFQTVWRCLEAGVKVELPSRSTSFAWWAETLLEHARGVAAAESERWRSLPLERCRPLPLDGPGEANLVSSVETVSVSLPEDESRRLVREVPRAYPIRVPEILLAALARTLAPSTGAPALLLDLEQQGRELLHPGVDLTRTVGWFTSLFPVVLESGDEDLGEALKSVKETLRRVPRQGLDYGVLRYLSPDPEVRSALAQIPAAGVRFNYLGRLEGLLGGGELFSSGFDTGGSLHAPEGRRSHPLEVEVRVQDDRLWVDWRFSSRLHRRETVEVWAREHLDRLRELVDHCLSGATDLTPWDFPEAGLTQAELDELLEEMGS